MATRNQRVKAILEDLKSHPDRCFKDPSIMQYTRVKKACKSYKEMQTSAIEDESKKIDTLAQKANLSLVSNATSQLSNQGATAPLGNISAPLSPNTPQDNMMVYLAIGGGVLLFLGAVAMVLKRRGGGSVAISAPIVK